MFYRTGISANQSFTLQEYGLWTISVPVSSMTFIYGLYPYEICADVNFLRQRFRRLSSDIHTHIQTTPKLYTMPLCRRSRKSEEAQTCCQFQLSTGVLSASSINPTPVYRVLEATVAYATLICTFYYYYNYYYLTESSGFIIIKSAALQYQ